MQEKIKFFTYGLLNHPGVLEVLTGKENIKRTSAEIQNFGLFVQRLDQVPNTPVYGLPEHLAPQKVLRTNWQEGFESYMIKPKEESSVTGSIVELDREDIEFISEWELEGLGWYRPWNGTAVTQDGLKVNVLTDGWRQGQEIDREVDGHNYETLLPGQDIEKFRKVAAEIRREFISKRSESEGRIKTSTEAY